MTSESLTSAGLGALSLSAGLPWPAPLVRSRTLDDALLEDATTRIATERRACEAKDIAAKLTVLLADVFAFRLKTKSLEWRLSGQLLMEHHLMLQEQAAQLLAMTDAIAGQVRKLGGTGLRSIGHLARLQRIRDNDADQVTVQDIFLELRADNEQLAAALREAQDLCRHHGDTAAVAMIEGWIEDAQNRIWFFYEAPPVLAGEGAEVVA